MSRKTENNTDIRALSTGQLKALLREELNRKRIDRDQVQLILSVLRQREEMTDVQIPASAAGQWQSLQQTKMLPEQNAWQKRGLRVARIAAVLVLVLSLTVVVPRALGAENLLSALGRWTDDFFSFVGLGEPIPTEPEYVFQTDNPELQQVYDAVTSVGITSPVVPTWLPEGYALEDFHSKETSSGYKVTAVF